MTSPSLAERMKTTSETERSDSTLREADVPLALQDLDPSTRFIFYTPHTITGLLLGVGALVYFSRAFDPPQKGLWSPDNLEANIRHGIAAAVAVFLGYAVLQGPSTSMVRPHPAVWRIVHGIVIIYLLILVFMLFLDASQARQLLKILYPKLGIELPERSYGGDCRLYIPDKGINWETISSTLFDEFVIAHTLGWWGKAVILRDPLLLWILSIGFELMELTFSHMLPNFNECWWDSWILDVAMCNFLGLWLGMKTVRWFGSLEYNWSGISKQPTIYAKARRSIAQFWPHSWDNFNWKLFSSPMRCLQGLTLIAVFLLVEVNAFFLKYILWVPPLNPLNTYRLCLYFLVGIPAVREYYVFIEGREVDVFRKLGPFAWLAGAVAFAETLVCIKFGQGMFPASWPHRVLLCWGISGALFALVMGVWSVNHYVLRRGSSRQKVQ